jgi:hypothetical protein
MLELTEATRQRIHKLQELADKAEEEDGARRELRRRLREETPEVLARCSDFARSYRRLLAERSSGGNPLRKEAISERAGRMAIELAGDNPTPLEALLSERVASMWVLVELQEALMAAWYYKGGGTPMSVVLQMARLQAGPHKTLHPRRAPNTARSTPPQRSLFSSVAAVPYPPQRKSARRPTSPPRASHMGRPPRRRNA